MDKEKVKEIIEKIKPSLQADGGDVEIVEITDDGIVKVELQGACAGCPMSTLTVKNGIEKTLKENVPEVKEVKSI
ncbi:MAG: NifU family protein [Halanaerobiaceae bacterium]